jgi:hypothetical protein
MFAMSHKERMLFFVVAWRQSAGSVLNSLKIVETDDRIVGFLEVFFLSIVAFFFDGYDYNQKLE